MRFVSFERNGETGVGLRDGDEVVDLSVAAPELPADLLGLLRAGDDAMAQAAAAGERAGSDSRVSFDELSFLPLIPRPPKIVCIGRNYAAHAAEGGAETPTYPEIFYRGATSLIGHGQAILRPMCSDKLDYEGELVAIVGRRARHVAEDDALSVIAGYALFNDATLRDYQRKSSQWTVGKNFDGTGAFGPEFVSADELPPGAQGLRIQTRLNGRVMQDANTEDLVFPMARLIAILTECMTLEPGDAVVTGTPSGVGYARTPPVFMRAGDVCEVEVEGVGVLRNPVRDEEAA
jgi:2-keto-4-pentenoate hydratase/2-oxohepta-3-ene-1,7-dioic acid hydratase in catechol pathway